MDELTRALSERDYWFNAHEQVRELYDELADVDVDELAELDVPSLVEDLGNLLASPIVDDVIRHACPDCDRSFASTGGLATHMRSHAASTSVAEETTVHLAASTPGDVLARLDRQTELVRAGELAKARLVDEARAAGHSWSAIAAQLGVSKQAAQKRYGSTPVVVDDPAQLTLDG